MNKIISKTIEVVLILTLAFIGFSIHAQIDTPEDLKIFTGPDFKNERKEPINQIIGKDTNGILVLGRTEEYLILYNYAINLELLSKKNVSLQFERGRHDFHAIIVLDESYYLITSYLDKKARKVVLFRHELDRKNLSISNPKIITSHTYEGFNRNEPPNFDIKKSKDGNHLICITSLPIKKENTYHFELLLLNKNLDVKWSKSNLEISTVQPNMVPYDAIVGLDGSVYLLAKIYDPGKKKRELDYRFELHKFNEESDKPMIFKPLLDNRLISDLKFELLRNGNLCFIGFVGNEEGMQTGVFSLVMDSKSVELIRKNTIDFPAEFVAQHGTEKEKRRALKKSGQGKDVGFYQFDVDELIEHENGSVTMIGEQYSYFQNCYTDGTGSLRCTDNYVYGNILTVKFSEIGEVQWMDLIPKYQQTVNDGGYFSGYNVSQLTDGSINLIFNDNPKNSYYQDTGEHYSWSGTTDKTDVVVYNIEEEGKTNRYVLLRGSDEELMSRPKVAMQLNESEVLILGESRKTYRFYRLSFE